MVFKKFASFDLKSQRRPCYARLFEVSLMPAQVTLPVHYLFRKMADFSQEKLH